MRATPAQLVGAMSDATMEIVSIWIFVPSVVIFMTVTAASYAISPRRTRPGRRSKQVESLRAELQAIVALQKAPQINWLDYRELTKPELKDIAAEYSWQYADQEVLSTGWLVRFKPSQGNYGP